MGQLYEAEKLAARKLVDGGLNELRCSSANREDLKRLSHEIDFKTFDKNLQNLT